MTTVNPNNYPPEKRVFAVIEDNKIINVIVGVEDEVVAANPGKYIEYTDGWDFENGIDGNGFLF
jgi:hypothetical protein